MNEKQLVFGLHTVESLLKNQPDRLLQLSIFKDRQDQKIQELIQLAQIKKIKIEDLLERDPIQRLVRCTVPRQTGKNHAYSPPCGVRIPEQIVFHCFSGGKKLLRDRRHPSKPCAPSTMARRGHRR